LAFVRQRHGLPHGDLDRIQRQQTFLASMARVVLAGDTLTDSTKRNNLIAAIRKTTVLDRGWDIVGLARQLQGMGAGDIHFGTIPVVAISQHTAEDGDAVEVDPRQVQAFVQEQIDGMHYPDAMGLGTSTPAAFTLKGPPAPQAPLTGLQGSETVQCVN
ncbi:MAG: LCP family protein, partial [Pseudonocardiaceae bacterium]